MAAFNGPGGCKDLIGQCRALGAEGDPLEYGRNETVNEFCGAAFFTCFTSLQEAYFATGVRPLRFLINAEVYADRTYIAYPIRYFTNGSFGISSTLLRWLL